MSSSKSRYVRHYKIRLELLSLLAGAVAIFAPAYARPVSSHAPGHGTPEERKLESLSSKLLAGMQDPGSALLIHRMLDLAPLLPGRERLENVLSGVGASAGAHPLVRDHARFAAAVLARQRGDVGAEARFLQRIGYVRSFMVLGPFENHGTSQFFERLAPEKDGYSPQKTYKGKDRPVKWRAFPVELSSVHGLDISHHLDQDKEACAYLAATIHAEHDENVALRLGFSGPIAIWLGSKIVYASIERHPARLDQAAIGLALAKGGNSLFVKTCAGDDGWRLLMRITRPEGGPAPGARTLAGGTFVSDLEPVPALKGPAFQRKEPGLSPLELAAVLKEKAESGLPGPRRLLDLAYCLKKFMPFDKEEELEVKAAETAIAMAQDEPGLLVQAAALLRDPNRARGVIDLALEADPENLDALRAAAKAALSRGRLFEAASKARQALEIRPSDLSAAMLLAETMARAGMPAAGIRVLSSLEKRRLSALAPARLMLDLASGAGLDLMADEWAEKILGPAKADRSALARLTSRAFASSNLDRYLSVVRAALTAEPWANELWTSLARTLQANHREEEALETIRRAISLAPESAKLHSALARILDLQGERDEAEAEYRLALDLKPQNPDLRDYLDFRTSSEKDFYSRYVRNVKNFVKKAPGPVVSGGYPAEVILNETVVRVHKNGLSDRFNQYVVKVLNGQGARMLKTRSIRFTPGSQRVRVLAARVYRSDGSVSESASVYERSLSVPEHRMYYDVRAKVIELPDISPGDIIEVQVLISDKGENLFSKEFGDLAAFQDTVPMQHAEYVLLFPRNRKMYFSPLPDGVDMQGPIPGDLDGTTKYVLSASNVPAIDPEVSMPGLAEVAKVVHISTVLDWNELGKWYGSLVANQFSADQELKKQVEMATMGLDGTRAKVDAIYELVVGKTRYVALEFGLYSYKPYPAYQVLARGFGDCKDKAVLMITMLEQAGIEAYMAIARTRQLGRLPERPASLKVLNHAFVYVPELNRFLDPTAEWNGPSSLPPVDQGIFVLLVSPHGDTRTMVTPVSKPQDNLDETIASVKLEPDGSALVEAEKRMRGGPAPGFRKRYEPAAERKERLEADVSSHLPGARVLSVDVSDPRDLDSDFVITYALKAPDYATVSGNTLVLRPTGRSHGYSKRLCKLSSRKYDLLISYPFIQRWREVISIPEGFDADVPESGTVDSKFGAARLDVSRKGDKVEVLTEMRIDRARIKASEYEEFRSFVNRADSLLSTPVRFEKRRPEGS